jgi:hypothetical protein
MKGFRMTETEVKYLSGLIDADGSIGFEFTNKRVYLALSLIAADSIDQHGFVKALPETTGYGTVCEKTRSVETWSKVSVWKVTKAKDLEMLLPRLIKHMVIKGKHFQRMFEMWQKYRSTVLDDIIIEQLRTFVKASRADAGPVKPKKHPTWAWVAGYLDGDGSFVYKKAPSQSTPRMFVQATAHENDKVSLELLHKAFGGILSSRGKTCPHIWDWKHSLGRDNNSFALHFLTKVHRHLRLKKHKVETMLAVCHFRTRTD